ncbi:MAG TPA: hypothetical protein VFP63_07940 [Dehalococcoidia bacterium]|nr:hypothetical protein [Dehalococcoidia bacterium]
MGSNNDVMDRLWRDFDREMKRHRQVMGDLAEKFTAEKMKAMWQAQEKAYHDRRKELEATEGRAVVAGN